MAAKTLADYQAEYALTLADKPKDGSIPNQVAALKADGTVVIKFSSNDLNDIRALRDWLSGLIGQPA
jgi:hypothetical protein